MVELKHFLIWSTLINYLVLIVWFAAFAGAHGWLYGLHKRWFQITPEVFNALHYGCMAIYKILILVFNLVPLVVLAITR